MHNRAWKVSAIRPDLCWKNFWNEFWKNRQIKPKVIV